LDKKRKAIQSNPKKNKKQKKPKNKKTKPNGGEQYRHSADRCLWRQGPCTPGRQYRSQGTSQTPLCVAKCQCQWNRLEGKFNPRKVNQNDNKTSQQKNF
jgi:hypothetical protein